MPEALTNIHATCIAVEGRAALIMGPSGAGKSDLALRAVTTTFNDGGRAVIAMLIADDQVLIERSGDRLLARAPATIAGRLEVRGMGIVTLPSSPGPTEVCLIADVSPGQAIARLPDPPEARELLAVRLPLLRLAPFEAAAPHKLVLALLRLDTR